MAMFLMHYEQSTYYYYVLLFLVEHRASTRFIQRSRFFATTFNAFHVGLQFFISISSDLFHDIFGLPRCLLPWGFHFNASQHSSEYGFLSVWPIQLYLRLLISFAIGSRLHFSRSSSFEIVLGHQMFITGLKHNTSLTSLAASSVGA